MAVVVIAAFTGCHQNTVLGDLVWHDLDDDGIQDEGEPGLPGVTVNVCVWPDDESGFCGTTVTDAGGRWSYRLNVGLVGSTDVDVMFDWPRWYRSAWSDRGEDDARDSDGSWVMLRYGHQDAPAADDTIDFGLVRESFVIGDFVWHDENANGLQDDGEPGVGGIRVDLIDETDTVVQTTTSRADGSYDMAAAEGEYRLRFSGLPAGVTFTQPHLQPAGRNSVVDTETGMTEPRLFFGDVDYNTIDAGLLSDVPITRIAEVGDYVWLDSDEDGHQDPDERGVQGVTVELRDSEGQTIDETITDAKGRYRFTGLAAGDYRVRFVPPSGNYRLTGERDRGPDDRFDSDAGPDGLSHLVRLDPGEVDETVDAGVVLRQLPS